MDFQTDEDAKLLSDVFQRHGSTVEKLDWINWSSYKFKQEDVVRMLNSMPNLANLRLSSWREEFEGSAGPSLKLMNLKRLEIEECDGFLLTALAQALPENVLEEFSMKGVRVSNETLKNFLSRQKSIKRLDFDGEFDDAGIFSGLKLTHLSCLSWENEALPGQRSFLKKLLQSQPGLVSLNTLEQRDYAFNFVNGEVFQEIVSMKQLETLKINVDGISSADIRGIALLSNLKNLELKTNRESSLEAFRELSLIKTSPLAHLVLHLWTFEIPAETYKHLGENFRLKSLEITLGTWHKVNFFIESFPTLESLSIRFGEANNPVELSEAYIDDGKSHLNMKQLKLHFRGNELADAAMVTKMIKSFPNLIYLDLQSKVPFTSAFFREIASNLSKIKVLKLREISVRNNETFPPETIQSLKELSRKLTYCSLDLRNVQMVDFGGPQFDQDIDGENRNFTFQPLIDALKDDFEMQSSSMANIRIYNILTLTSGRDVKK